MMRSLYAGVSGLRNHQTKMDVVGNNIANVNTVGYKASRVTFQDMLSQSLQGASRPQGNAGGTNPIQIGLGVGLASVDKVFTDGGSQTTNVSTDLALSGSGFFQLSNDGGKSFVYSRDGAFSFDTNGDYVSAAGYKVMGYKIDPATGKTTGVPAAINIPKTDTMTPKASSAMTVIGNVSASTTAPVTAAATALISAREASVAAAGAAALPGATAASVAAAVLAHSSAGVMDSGVSAGDVTIADNAATVLGSTAKSVAQAMAANLAAAITATDTTSDVSTSLKVYDSLGNAYTLGGTLEKSTTGVADEWIFKPTGTITDPTTGATIANVTTTPITPTDTETIRFNSTDGSFKQSFSTFVGAPAAGVAATHLKITVTPTGSPLTTFTVTPDFSTMTQYASEATAASTETDGYPDGTLDKLTVNSSGVFVGTYTNGLSKELAKVALYSFNNPQGLESSGGNFYTETNNSGTAMADTTSKFTSGALEMSNVDLAQQFSDMIVTQRGFQANSKIITTSDTMIEELINLKR